VGGAAGRHAADADEADLAELQGLNERVSMDEVETIYLPSRACSTCTWRPRRDLHKANDTFLGSTPALTPYVIGVAGSVAVGKSTFARILRALLARWPDHPRVDLVTTDGFLWPNRVLEDARPAGAQGLS
jgi:type I pantothenate kinase